jgi:hypothetical protein
VDLLRYSLLFLVLAVVVVLVIPVAQFKMVVQVDLAAVDVIADLAVQVIRLPHRPHKVKMAVAEARVQVGHLAVAVVLVPMVLRL